MYGSFTSRQKILTDGLYTPFYRFLQCCLHFFEIRFSVIIRLGVGIL
jgi:hypothetical protein